MEDRAKYFNISYVKQSLSPADVDYKYNSSLGVAITNGRTYYLHKKPILGMIKFGIDWSFFDVNVAMYENEFTDGYEVEKENMYQAEVGMQIGPSVTVNPIDHLKVNGYFRVTPSYSMMYSGMNLMAVTVLSSLPVERYLIRLYLLVLKHAGERQSIRVLSI